MTKNLYPDIAEFCNFDPGDAGSLVNLTSGGGFDNLMRSASRNWLTWIWDIQHRCSFSGQYGPLRVSTEQAKPLAGLPRFQGPFTDGCKFLQLSRRQWVAIARLAAGEDVAS